MTEQGDPAKPFRIDLDPKAEATTSIGQVFIYESEHRTVEAYAKKAAGDTPSQVRAYLVGSSSTTERKTPGEKIAGLTEKQARALTDDDIEQMASAYLGTMNNAHYIAKAKTAEPGLQRNEGESSVAFLDRLLRWCAEDYKRSMKDLMDGVRGGNVFAVHVATKWQTRHRVARFHRRDRSRAPKFQ